MKRMKTLEEQFMSNTALHDPALIKKAKGLQEQKPETEKTDGDPH